MLLFKPLHSFLLSLSVNCQFRVISNWQRPQSAMSHKPVKPKLIVFDLDYTLWPFFIDSSYRPPYTTRNGSVLDRQGAVVPDFPDVPSILERLHADGYSIAAASRTSSIEEAKSLVHVVHWGKHLDYLEIYPCDKQTHFKSLQKRTGLKFSEMLFFDDEQRNIDSVEKLGVVSIYVPDGVTRDAVTQGLRVFSKRRSSITTSSVLS